MQAHLVPLLAENLSDLLKTVTLKRLIFWHGGDVRNIRVPIFDLLT